MSEFEQQGNSEQQPSKHQRRRRYSGTHPKSFQAKIQGAQSRGLPRNEGASASKRQNAGGHSYSRPDGRGYWLPETQSPVKSSLTAPSATAATQPNFSNASGQREN